MPANASLVCAAEEMRCVSLARLSQNPMMMLTMMKIKRDAAGARRPTAVVLLTQDMEGLQHYSID